MFFWKFKTKYAFKNVCGFIYILAYVPNLSKINIIKIMWNT